MKKNILAIGLGLLSMVSFAQEKLVDKATHVKFYSHTSLEDITSHTYKVSSTFDPSTGIFVFSVPMQSFEFKESMRTKHFNSSKFLDTKQFPKAKFKGTVVDFSKVNLKKDGTYNVSVSGDFTLHGVTKKITEKGKIVVKGGKISASAVFPVILKEYGIFFEKGKPSTNVAKEVEVTVEAKY